jgi:hypothetical protein
MVKMTKYEVKKGNGECILVNVEVWMCGPTNMDMRKSKEVHSALK